MGAVGLVAVVLSWDLAQGTATGGPDARFFPMILGTLLVVLGAAVAVRPVRDPEGGAAPGGRTRAAWTLGTVLAYVATVERLGFLVATGAMLTILLVVYGERRPPVVVLVAAAATGAAYALFALWLKVPLPRGILGP
jgi:putative tricarboxylic transport membrane protein